MSENRGVDLIEVGRGKESKIIGQNNTISEYGHTALAMIAFCGQGSLVAWVVIGLWLYYVNFTIFWSVVLGAIFSLSLTIGAILLIVKLVMMLHTINTPPQVRDERGRYTTRETPVNSMGKRVGTIHTMENGQSEYISRWGRGDD